MLKAYIPSSKLLSTSILFFLVILTQAQPVMIWQKSYGGSLFEQPFTTELSFENGFISGGHSISSDSDITSNYGDFDYWILKLDSNGNKIWSKSFGGSLYDKDRGLALAPDSSILCFGSVKSNDIDITGFHGVQDFWLLKLDYNGNKVWAKCYGGSSDEAGYIVSTNFLGNYMCGGNSLSHDGDITNYYGMYDVCVIEVTPDSGNIIRYKNYGGSNHDEIRGIQQWPDSDYVFAGNTRSDDGDLAGTVHTGGEDLWAVRMDQSGNIKWSVQYGTYGPDRARHITRDYDGNVLLTGKDSANSGIVTDNHGDGDIWLVKLDYQDGSVIWQKSFGGSNKDEGYRTVPTPDHGYLVGASTRSNDGDVPFNRGNSDYFFLKLDSLLNIEWTYTAGGPVWDHMNDVVPTSDGAYLGVGYSNSVAGPNSQITNNKGDYDSWYIKFGFCDTVINVSVSGNTQICIGDSVTLTATTGQTYLWNSGETTQSIIITNAGTYSVTVTKWDNACIQHSTSVVIDTFPQPVAPVITASQGTLSASSGVSYQWYFNGSLITDTTQTINATSFGSYEVIVTDSNGCSATSQTFLFTGIADFNNHESLIISNPVINNEIFVQNKNDFKPTTFELFDITGKKIFRYKTELQQAGVLKIKLPFIKTGLYFLKMSDNNGFTHNAKIIVE